MSTDVLNGSLSLPADAPRAARTAMTLLSRLQHGRLDLQLPDGSTAALGQRNGHAEGGGERAALRIHDWAMAEATLKSGDIGLGESYIQGHWSSPDLAALLTLFLHNRNALEAAVYGRWWGALLYRLKHLLNRNTRQGSRRNIVAHYDLGNAFYRLWLDSSMNYSSAWFEEGRSQSMYEAQQAKMARALRAVALQPGQRLLEIGCGWGAVAEMAARDFNAQVLGLTLSDEQLAYARQRLQAAGLHSQTELRLQDYRDLPEQGFDAVVSIEMFEAVGREYWGDYFQALKRSLKPGGLACVQSITLQDALWERYSRGTDFIQQYIFPGGLLPSPERFEAEARRAGLEVQERFAFGLSYAETLKRWRADFLRHEGAVREQGFDEKFIRCWEFYLAYCEAAFATGNCDVCQFTLRRPA
ncbi:MAG: class I SAM-dependent methyltransferase [Burkholderiales bacterium]|uniref:class I SAM-dependent methyltransferase n=1 Tax=Inhella sp. TaxID=1921806 RepID=UPI001ACEEA1F|nr:class I SAM-dependent methyltransferase [Burkholderiales bacterium]